MGQGIIIGLVVKLIYFNAALYLVYRLAYIMELFQAGGFGFGAIVSLIFIPYDYYGASEAAGVFNLKAYKIKAQD